MMGLTWIRSLVARRTSRLATAAIGVAVAVALLASLGMFLSSSKSTMTARAIATVPVDWQIEVQPGADPAAVLSKVTKTTGVEVALPVGFGSTTGFKATAGGSTQTTGAGVVLGLPANYRTTFPGEIRQLIGSPTGVLVAQQAAANLHVAVGDTVTFDRGRLPSAHLKVDGVIDLPQANSLFQRVGAPIGAQPQAPPDNVILVPAQQWHQLFDGLRNTSSTHFQVHARISHALPSDPGSAFTSVGGSALNLEAKLAGDGLVGNNLGATLDAARSDALYAQVMFLFLGMPGAVLAGLLTITLAAAGSERRRREQGLLRTRGANVSQLISIALMETLVVAGAGGLLGLGTALVVGRLVFGTAGFGLGAASALVWGIAALTAGLLVSALAIARPAAREARNLSVSGSRDSRFRAETPRWQRAWLDLMLLAAAAVVFWITGKNGYHLVLAPEGAPQISVSYWAFSAPLFAWAGIGLLTLRLSDVTLRKGRSLVAKATRSFAGNLSDTVAGSMGRQRRILGRGTALVALTIAFAISTAVFNSTYRQQTHVDALLTNGADVAVNVSPGAQLAPADVARIAKVPGVSSVEPLQHRFAYVGADLQDLFGVRPSTIVGATGLQDAYFVGGTAQQLMDKIAASPDAVLVSDETVKDFQLHFGDSITLRLRSSDGNSLIDVPFHYAGIVREFPTAPSDSFLVANADYIAQQTGSGALGTLLVDTSGVSPTVVADALQRDLGTSAQVTDINSSTRLIGSSLTAVDLAGLTKVELVFALVLAAAATGLVLGLGLAERKRTFAIASALGAKDRQIGGFVWSEAAFVAIGGILLGTIGGWALSEMLVKILTGVFDPPPSSLSVPWGYLVAVGGVALGAIVSAGMGTVRKARVPHMEVLRTL
jgi:putative ABC transport system permease protein